MADEVATLATSKIKIRIGDVEVDYEGAHGYISDALPKLLETIVELRQRVASLADGDGDDGNADGTSRDADKDKDIRGTVTAIAAKLNVEEAADLVIAAMAKLTFVDKQQSSDRKVILAAMQSATGYYKPAMSSNLTKTFKGLLAANRITEPASGQFALMALERKKLEGKLA